MLEVEPSGQRGCGWPYGHWTWPKWQWSIVGFTSEAFIRWLQHRYVTIPLQSVRQGTQCC